VEDFNAAAQDPSFSGMLIDHEHAKLDLQKETVAYGWLMSLQGRADGIYGKIRWTATGQAAVDGGDYRFFSTEYDPADMEVLSDGKHTGARPMSLDGLTLTNAPNNKGGSPITNRGGGESAAAGTSEGACRAFGLVVNRKRATLKCSFDHAWNLAAKAEPMLFAAMAPRREQAPVAPARNRAMGSQVDCACLAGELLRGMAQAEQLARGGRFDDHWHKIRNRAPRLFRIANRQDGWDAVADIEPTAHAAYMRVQADPTAFERGFETARDNLRGQFPELDYAGLNEKAKELYPDLVSQLRTERKATSPSFAKIMSSIMVQFPELGFEGRWEKAEELYPTAFWKFVLSFAAEAEAAS
jgi:hypothetical protein